MIYFHFIRKLHAFCSRGFFDGYKQLDYLQVFRIKNCKEGVIIEHSQEVPKYKERYILTLEDIEIEGNIKVFLIDDGIYSTMMLAEEY